ncbi:hypothetical protein FKM82_022992 [Ascaphus truei]
MSASCHHPFECFIRVLFRGSTHRLMRFNPCACAYAEFLHPGFVWNACIAHWVSATAHAFPLLLESLVISARMGRFITSFLSLDVSQSWTSLKIRLPVESI